MEGEYEMWMHDQALSETVHPHPHSKQRYEVTDGTCGELMCVSAYI